MNVFDALGRAVTLAMTVGSSEAQTRDVTAALRRESFGDGRDLLRAWRGVSRRADATHAMG